MRALVIILFVAVCTIVRAQNFKVRHFMSQSSKSTAREIFEISPNAYLGMGFVIDTSSGNAINRLTLTGLDAQGKVQWEKRYGGLLPEFLNNGFTQRCMINYGGHLYYAGCMKDTTRQIGVLVKFDYNGDTLWRKIYRSNDPQEDVILQMVTPSIDGGFLITGFFQIWGGGGQPCLLIKTDANGNELWRRKINKSAPNVLDGKAIIQDSASGKIVIGGYQYKNGNSIYDSFIITDSLGNNPVQKSFTNAGGWITDLIQTWDKKIVAVGWMYTTVTLSGDPTMQPFVVKFDLNNPSNGIWRTPNINMFALTNGFTGIKELENHDLLICGLVDTISGVVGATNLDLPNIWIRFCVFDQNGNLKWNRFYDNKNNDSAVQYIQGMRSFNLCQDGGWVGAIDLTNYGINPFMFVRYDSTGCDTTQEHCKMMWTTSVRDEENNKQKITVYPNPAQTGFHINYSLQNNHPIIIEIKDVVGKTVYMLQYKRGENASGSNDKGSFQIYIPIEDLANGMYLIAIKQNEQIIYKTKLIKQK